MPGFPPLLEMGGYVFVLVWVLLGFYGAYHLVTDRDRVRFQDLTVRIEYLICLHHAMADGDALEGCAVLIPAAEVPDSTSVPDSVTASFQPGG
jgi:hypothetical protein